MKYAVIKTGGKQYKVFEGDVLEIEKLEPSGQTFEFSEVLLVVENNQVTIGDPFLPHAKVKAQVLDQLKGEKIRVAKYKAKSRYRKVKGHRQKLTRVKIKKIEVEKPKEAVKRAAAQVGNQQ